MPAAELDRREREDPFLRFLAGLSDRSGSAFYFERSESPGRPGRAAWFGFDPVARTVWREPQDVLSSQRAAQEARRRRTMGWQVGYVGFDTVGLFEPLLRSSTPKGSPFPPAVLDRYLRVERSAVPSRRRPSPERLRPDPPRLGRVRDSSAPAGYARSVERIREAIFDGEAFQVVLAHRRERPGRGGLLHLVDRLRREERFAYLFYLRLEDGDDGMRGPIEVAGASPESVVEVRGGCAAINPIAGTRPRPAPRGGPKARLPLDKDPKELAEHRMLVDLARNDLGRVCEVGSVRIVRREVRVRLARLEHLVSRVVGRLPPALGAFDVLPAAFPAGTVSGAPKIRATELLRREEGTWRGPYGGAVGLVSDRGEGDFALAIRTAAVVDGRRFFTEAGAGIVHLSEPQREWEETLAKLATVEGLLTGSLAAPARRGGEG